MQIYQERRRLRRFLRSRAVLFFLTLFIIVLLGASVRMGFLAIEASRARINVEKEYQNLAVEKDRLDKKIGNLGSQEAIEKEAKSRFNVTAPGEKVLVILDRSSSGLDLEAKPVGFWEYIKSLFR